MQCQHRSSVWCAVNGVLKCTVVCTLIGVEAQNVCIPWCLVDHSSHCFVYLLLPVPLLPHPSSLLLSHHPTFPSPCTSLFHIHPPLFRLSLSLSHHSPACPVVGYLVMFRLEEVGLSHVKKFVASQDTAKMFKVRTCTYTVHWSYNCMLCELKSTPANTNTIDHVCMYQSPELQQYAIPPVP